VDAPAGQLQGQDANGIHVFKGIPYAKPPVGDLRWKPPQPTAHWQGVRNATQFSPACMQPKVPSKSIYAGDIGAISEDCLYLNIWAPANASHAPVLFWIHGGAFTTGSGGEAMYDGAKLAARGIVVVSINYRLGVFGWLAHPELNAESARHVSGNYGLLDQVAALQWVKQNISAFGGDPSNVTIAGESSGGLSVVYLMASPDARGLFAKAIAQSAYMVSTPTLRKRKYGMPAAQDVGVWLLSKLNVQHIAGLRTVNAAKLTVAAAHAGFLPFGTVDGHVLPDQLVTIFDKGQQAHVPVLAGFNSGEIRSLRMLAPPVPSSAADYEKTIRARYGDLADAFLKLYPATDMQESIWATTRDALYGWTAERLVRDQTALGEPAFLYLFDHGYPAEDDAGLHAFHGSELPYVFGNLDTTPAHWPKIPDTDTETRLSNAMLDYWSSFAKAAKPVAKSAPDWPAYDTTASYMAFRATPEPSQNLLPGMYKLNEAVVCRRRADGDIAWNWNVGLASPSLPSKKDNCQ
jgi:para-nitrobenzyl esterase